MASKKVNTGTQAAYTEGMTPQRTDGTDDIKRLQERGFFSEADFQFSELNDEDRDLMPGWYEVHLVGFKPGFRELTDRKTGKTTKESVWIAKWEATTAEDPKAEAGTMMTWEQFISRSKAKDEKGRTAEDRFFLTVDRATKTTTCGMSPQTVVKYLATPYPNGTPRTVQGYYHRRYNEEGRYIQKWFSLSDYEA